MMKRLVGLLFTLCLLLPAFAGEATQTDWSGGDVVPGPVTDWGNQFDASTDINWSGVPGEIGLSRIEHTVDDDFNGAASVYAADVDGDGDLDLLGAAQGSNRIAWWENANGSGTSWTKHIVEDRFNFDPRSVYAADVDGDDDLDVLAAARYPNDITWWENDDGSGTSWTEHTVYDYHGGAISVYAADVDGDDDLDVLGAAAGAEEITWWENVDGSGTSWTEHTVDGDSYFTLSLYAADVDGDDDLDVLGAAFGADDDIIWWENIDGSGTSWTKHSVDDDFYGAASVYAADVDGDDDLDIMGAAYYADDIAWWENDDGSGTSWTKHSVDGDFDGAWSVYAADVDGDDNTDILGAAYDADSVTWWENADGSGTSWTEHTVDGSFAGAYSVYAADVNGDGDLDVLGAAGHAWDITWWEVTGFTDNGVLSSSILDTETDQPVWGSLIWSAQIPGDSALSVDVRASDDADSMGDWVEVAASGDDLSAYIPDTRRYFQYRLTLESSSSNESPIFEELTVNWEPATSLADVELSTQLGEGALLLAWTVTGDTPSSIRVLRGEENPVAVSGSLGGDTTRWLDRDVTPGESYVYWIEATDSDGYVERFGPTETVVVPELERVLTLDAPWPNPADNSVSVAFSLPEAQRVSLSVYDLAGRRVTTLSEGELPAGRHAVSWDCAGEAAGVYLLRLETEGEALSRRVVVGR
jgi:hypothetical protein